jgi:hypothetical protein
MKQFEPIGLAKDGRIIYGPYKFDGTLWQPCDVDVCNGVQFGYYYGYVSTMFHPYFVGCWGPGNRPVALRASCSSNGRYCSGAEYRYIKGIAALSIAALSAFLSI